MATIRCCAYNCGNKFGHPGVTFHRFPFDKPHLLTKWVIAMGKPKWAPSKDHFLCSEHFTDEMFNEKGGYRFARYDAVPTLFHVLPRPKSLFPSETPYRLFTVREVEEDFSKGYVIEAKLALGEEDQFYKWLKEHEALSRVNYKLLQKFPIVAGKHLSFKSEYGCRYVKSLAEPNCPAKLLVRIRSLNPKFEKPKDEDVTTYPCTVVLYHLHNHRVESNTFSVSSVTIDDVSEEVKDKFTEMFKGGYNADLAFSIHQTDLLEEYCDDSKEVLADQYLSPKLEWVKKVYDDFIKDFGEWNEENILSLLQKEISMINADEGKAKLQKVEDQTVVAICTPLMRRAHSLKSSGETVFVYSTGLMERCGCFLYILMTYSCCDGLPLGVLISTANTENVLAAGFKLLSEILPEKAFGQYGLLGPEVFLTSNNDAEQKSLQALFPEATLFLCSFALLRSLWQWLWDEGNGIQEIDRCTLFSLVHKVMKTKNIDEFNTCYNSILENEVVQKYANFQEYFRELCSMSEKWAVRFKNEIIDKDHESSAVEMATLVLKDQMYLTKSYNMPQLVRYLTNDLENYYKQKIIHSINNTLEKYILSSYRLEMRATGDIQIERLDSGQYKLVNPNHNLSYFIDEETFICSCPLGLSGLRCKHQYAVFVSNKLSFPNNVPDDDTIKKELHWIATNSLNSLLGSMEPESAGSDAEFEAMDDEEYNPKQDYQRKPKQKPGKKAPTTPRDEAKAILDRVVKDIIQRYDSYPVEYHKAIVAAAVNYQSLHYDQAIILALKNFGKNISEK